MLRPHNAEPRVVKPAKKAAAQGARMNRPPPPPALAAIKVPPSLPAFTEIPPPGGRCPHLGLARGRLYALSDIDPDVVIQLGGRSVIDAHRAYALVMQMPKGKRKPGSSDGMGRF